MNCPECSLAIEPDAKKMEMPCCAIVYHTQCGINRLFSGSYYSNVECFGCGTHLHDSPYYSTHTSIHSQDMAAANTLLEGDAKPDIKKLKEKSKELSAARKEFENHLKEEFVAFQEIALPQLEAIKALKESRMAAVRQSPQYKAFSSKKTSFTLMCGKFQKKFPTIPRRSLREKIGANYYCYSYSTAVGMLRRKFRLRKWYN